MKRRLSSIVLLDNNTTTNYIHKKFIKESECTDAVIDFQSGINALEYLKLENNPIPELILIDINMAIMNAWEFLENYKTIERDNKKTVILLLSTYLSPNDEEKAGKVDLINGIYLKPLTVGSIQDIMTKYFLVDT